MSNTFKKLKKFKLNLSRKSLLILATIIFTLAGFVGYSLYSGDSAFAATSWTTRGHCKNLNRVPVGKGNWVKCTKTCKDKSNYFLQKRSTWDKCIPKNKAFKVKKTSANVSKPQSGFTSSKPKGKHYGIGKANHVTIKSGTWMVCNNDLLKDPCARLSQGSNNLCNIKYKRVGPDTVYCKLTHLYVKRI